MILPKPTWGETGMTRRTTTRRRIAAVLLCGMLAAGLAACGDDDDDDDVAADDTTETTAADESGDEGDGEGDLAAYCENVLEVETAGEPDIDFETAAPEQIAEAAKAFAQEKMVDPAHAAGEAAPAEIREDVALLVAAVDELAETGDFEAAFDEEVEAASERVHTFDLANCEWGQTEVNAIDYGYEGIPSTLEAGPTSFDLTNGGEEMHELILLRKKDDTTETFDELLALPQEEAQAKVDVLGSIFAAPGEEGEYSVVDLEAGEYLAICFIPQGFTPEVAEAAESGGEVPEGPPHFTLGMKVPFTVE